MANNIEKLVEELSSLTIIEAAELSKLLEEKWGVTAASGVAVAAASAPAAEEKTEFDVCLLDAGSEKLKVVKDIKEISGLGLKESKDLADGASASSPKVVKSGVGKDEANTLKAKLEASGAKVELR